ncbi:hypothetical protein GCM10010977_32120 [Citricoccus zhacaiensis]|uniref:Uncharacterized protein n=1 Tax=Citricoccus zhacaiensis TaxID=489142 RepID=A0ABQ2MCU7_9MICC|nr:hypothetical protein GCM10010977_32120 [Citricoccus zhacaiensis]VXC22560.1 membrane hypothetical protein [Citricoccus sp. K5]
MFGLVSYVPLGMAYLALLHYFGPIGYRQLDSPGLGLSIGAAWLLILVPVFMWVNLMLARRLPLPRWVTWTGASIFLLGPFAFELLLS